MHIKRRIGDLLEKTRAVISWCLRIDHRVMQAADHPGKKRVPIAKIDHHQGNGCSYRPAFAISVFRQNGVRRLKYYTTAWRDTPIMLPRRLVDARKEGRSGRK